MLMCFLEQAHFLTSIGSCYVNFQEKLDVFASLSITWYEVSKQTPHNSPVPVQAALVLVCYREEAKVILMTDGFNFYGHFYYPGTAMKINHRKNSILFFINIHFVDMNR